VFPHAVSAVPVWHIPNVAPAQQPPLHSVTFGALQPVVQILIAASRQAWPAVSPVAAGQSPADVHPQWPLTQALPDGFDASQTVHVGPVAHALASVPGWQRPSAPQQAALQFEWLASPHALSHCPVVVLHAVTSGQSSALVQPGSVTVVVVVVLVVVVVRAVQQNPTSSGASCISCGLHAVGRIFTHPLGVPSRRCFAQSTAAFADPTTTNANARTDAAMRVMRASAWRPVPPRPRSGYPPGVLSS
jgi:hypothetical protein